MSTTTIPKNIPPINRHVTTHNSAGQAIFEPTIPSPASWTFLPEAEFFLGYCTKTFPADLTSTTDISTYQTFLNSPPGLVINGGTVLRIVDMKPGVTSAMHRTISLDYGVVLEGEVELILDSGETRLMRRGDTSVQRATYHAWRNTSQTEWARMLYVLVEAKGPEVAGVKMEEDLGGMHNVRKSN